MRLEELAAGEFVGSGAGVNRKPVSTAMVAEMTAAMKKPGRMPATNSRAIETSAVMA